MTLNEARPRLRVQRLVKSFFGVRVLHEVSFDAYGGRVLGVVGENGSGKSTTMNVLTGVLPRDSGEILLDGAPFAPASRRESDVAGIAFNEMVARGELAADFLAGTMSEMFNAAPQYSAVNQMFAKIARE